MRICKMKKKMKFPSLSYFLPSFFASLSYIFLSPTISQENFSLIINKCIHKPLRFQKHTHTHTRALTYTYTYLLLLFLNHSSLLGYLFIYLSVYLFLSLFFLVTPPPPAFLFHFSDFPKLQAIPFYSFLSSKENLIKNWNKSKNRKYTCVNKMQRI